MAHEALKVGSWSLEHFAGAMPEIHRESSNMYKLEPSATVVRNPEGQGVQKRIWDELMEKLDQIRTGVSRWNRYSPLGDWGKSLSQASVKAEGPESHSQEERRLGSDDIGGACSTLLLG